MSSGWWKSCNFMGFFKEKSVSDSSVGYYRLVSYATHHFSSLHCVLVFFIYFNDFRLCLSSQSQMPVSNAAAVGRTGYASSLVFTPPIGYQLCSCVVNQSRQPTCLKTNVFPAMCVSTRKMPGVAGPDFWLWSNPRMGQVIVKPWLWGSHWL